MMPRGGGDARGEALGHIAALRHQKLTVPEVGELLGKAEASDAGLNGWQLANLRAMRRMQVRAAALPQSLVRALKIATTRCEQTWRVARAANDWNAVARQLAEVLMLTREKAAALGNTLGLQSYDALLDGYEAGTRVVDVARVFDDLKGFLPDFLSRILDRQREPMPLRGPFPRERQRQLGVAMMRVFDFDFDRGRLDVSPLLWRRRRRHPHHHPLQRGRLPAVPHGCAARDRTRALPAGPATRVAAATRGQVARRCGARKPVAFRRDADCAKPRLHGVCRAAYPRSPRGQGWRGGVERG